MSAIEHEIFDCGLCGDPIDLTDGQSVFLIVKGDRRDYACVSCHDKWCEEEA